MLPKQNRLSVQEFYKNPQVGKRYHYPLFQIHIKPSGKKIPRFVILVPKRLDKRSSVRHRVKRFITESLRQKLPDIVVSADVVVKVQKLITSDQRESVAGEIVGILQKIQPVENPKA